MPDLGILEAWRRTALSHDTQPALMGVGVATLLAADEIEHHRCGIACVLEDTPSGGLAFQRIIRGGAADNTALEEGDVLLEVDGHSVDGLGVAGASDYIRGKEGSYVVLKVAKRSGAVTMISLQRQRVPGSKAELLGALWQQQGQKKKKVWTDEDKLGKLEELYRRGNLSKAEYEAAIVRLKTGASRDPEQQSVDTANLFGSVWNALSEDFAGFTEDPDVRRLKLSRENSREAKSPQNGPATPQKPPAMTSGGALLTDEKLVDLIHAQQGLSPTSSSWYGWEMPSHGWEIPGFMGPAQPPPVRSVVM